MNKSPIDKLIEDHQKDIAELKTKIAVCDSEIGMHEQAIKELEFLKTQSAPQRSKPREKKASTPKKVKPAKKDLEKRYKKRTTNELLRCVANMTLPMWQIDIMVDILKRREVLKSQESDDQTGGMEMASEWKKRAQEALKK